MFLALWHGVHSGYFLCFFLEFLDMEAEKRVQRLNQPLVKWLTARKPLHNIWNVLCYLTRTMSLHYGLTAFVLKKSGPSFELYAGTYWFNHILVVVIYIVDAMIPPAKEKKRTE